jgi:hypothetical protein
VAGAVAREPPASIGPAVISGDPVLAERLIANLVDNAVRYNAAAGDICRPAPTGPHRPSSSRDDQHVPRRTGDDSLGD